MGYDGIPDTMTLNDAITIHPVPVAAFIIENGYLSAVVDSAVFNNESTGATSFQWNFGNGSTSNLFEPTPHFDLVGTYDVTLTVSNEFGCEDHTSILNGITVVSDGFINFPTAFTPKFQGSSDGSYDRFALDNDIFHPHYRSVLYYDLEIFNKWGELIFKTDNIKVGWDGHYQGNMLGEDTYVYKSKGQLFGGIPFEKSGTVTLLLK
jgi:gliding motility-associated-like protein